ncbi:MAG: RNA-binding domain-containing protein [Patescibacteria group bacterium]
MNTQTTIKRSPVVLIRTLVAIEFLFFVVYWLATGPDSYKYEIYTKLFFSGLFSYETFKLFFLSGAQLLITIYAFARWYYESYSIRPGSLTHQWGVFWRKNKSIPLDKQMSVTLSSGPLGKLLHYGTIKIESGQKSLSLSDISRPRDFIRVVERCINPEHQEFRVEPNVSKLLSAEEHERLEFKSSLRFDHHTAQVNRDLEKTAMKTITAFLNTRGGHLVLGVNDGREPVGLEADYQTLRRPDGDGFENHFTQVFNTMIGPEFRHLVKLWFRPANSGDICIVQVAPSPRPVYMKLDDNEHFYVRTGNVTTPLKLSEVEAYRRSRFPHRPIVNV